MLNIKTLPLLLKIIAKIDLTPIIDKLKTVDIFENADNSTEAKRQLSKEKVGVVAMEIISELTPQLGKIADDIPALVATYKDISIEEANTLDSAQVINEIINDGAIIGFFKHALQKKVEQTV